MKDHRFLMTGKRRKEEHENLAGTRQELAGQFSFYQCVSQREMQRVLPDSHELLMSGEKCGGKALGS